MYNLSRVNDLLNKKDEVITNQETEIMFNGPDVMKNILYNELVKQSRLNQISDELIGHLSKDISKQTRKEQQSFWRDVEAVRANSRDFTLRFIQEGNKSAFFKDIIKLAKEPQETVISENGEVLDSSITDDKRKYLADLVFDMLNEQTRGQVE